MRLNKSFQDATIEIFKNIFSPEQIEKMIEVDLSGSDNKLILPVDKYLEKQFKIADSVNPNDNENAESDPNEIILASYTLMDLSVGNNSPGVITFYKDNIKLYIMSIIDYIDSPTPIGLNTALYIHYFVMYDLLTHEGFHHFSDIKRHLTDSKFDIKMEERLAVGHSYNTFSGPFFKRRFDIDFISVYDKFVSLSYNKDLFARMRNENRMLFDFMLTEHFMSYYSSDYRNWQRYILKDCYQTHFYNYFRNSKSDELLANGVPVNKIAEEIRLFGIEGAQIVVE
jgi:hypothetical protein